jgi:hypothetical protein
MAASIGSALLAFYAAHVLQLTHGYTNRIAVSAYVLALIALCVFAPAVKKVEFV